jgi:hypothetical protein
MEDSTDPAPRRVPLPRWTVPIVAVVALLLGAAVLVLLWRWIDGLPFADAEKRATAHIEALKVASGIVIGGGGLFALYLAARRQRTQESELEVRRIELAQRDRVQIHAEQVADNARQDAVERRVTDLYTKAADQLGSDKAPVRLAGLYALERLGQGNPDHRQTVIDVVCAYLRMPYTPPDEQSETDDLDRDGQHEELQVRRTAQHILANHLREDPHQALRSPPVGQSTFWPDIHLDLSGAHLVGFVLTDSRLNVLDLNGATLTGGTVLRGTQCDLALMQRMDVQGHADFRGIVFTNSAWIAYSTFCDGVWFHGDEFYPGARFGRHASFHGTTFHGNVRFGRAVFAGSVDFRETKWPQGTESIEFEGVLVEHPEMTSPEGDAATSSWPEGWRVKITDDHGTLERGY